MSRSIRVCCLAVLAWTLSVLPASAETPAKITLVTTNPQAGQPITFAVTFDNCLSGTAPDRLTWGLRFALLDPQTGHPTDYPGIGKGKGRVPTHADDVDTEPNAYAEVGSASANSTIQVTTTLPAGRYHPRVLLGCYNDADLSGTTAEIVNFEPYEFTVGGGGTTPSTDPIIFIPGMMGSTLACGSTELWMSILTKNLERLALRADGRTDVRGACGRPITSTGALRSTFGVDVYGSALDYFAKYAADRGRRAYTYHFDWRKSPEDAVAGLDALIDLAKRETGSAKVMIAAHSMGGLVTQLYVRDAARAQNVSRAITVGTPYWGAPKSWLPISKGWTSPDTFDELDMALDNEDIRLIAQNMAGGFSLLPSANYHAAYGHWLSLSVGAPLSGGNRRVAPGSVSLLAGRVGANAALVRAAQQMHAHRLDGFVTNGVDYHVLVGAGLATVTRIDDSLTEDPDFGWGDGDITVPLLSQTQGVALGQTQPADAKVTFSRVCQVEHMSQMSDPKVQSFLTAALTYQEPPSGSLEPCGQRRTTVTITILPNLSVNVSTSILRANAAATLPASVRRAIRRGDAQLLPGANGSYQLVVDASDKLTLGGINAASIIVTPNVPGSGTHDKRGASRYYAPAAGVTTLQLAGTGALPTITQRGKALRVVAADRRAPVVRASVMRSGKHAVVRFTVTDASKRAAIWVRASAKQPFTRLRGTTWRVPWATRGGARYFVTDRFGNATAPKALPRAR